MDQQNVVLEGGATVVKQINGFTVDTGSPVEAAASTTSAAANAPVPDTPLEPVDDNPSSTGLQESASPKKDKSASAIAVPVSVEAS